MKLLTATILFFWAPSIWSRIGVGAALVGGDINHDVSIFPSWSFQSEGWSTSKQIAQDVFGKSLPPTFKDSTHQDLLLVPPALISSVTDIRVEQDSPFPDYNPVYVSFDLHVQAGRKYVWKVPRPFTKDQRKHLRSKDLGQVWLGVVAGNQQEDGQNFQMWCQHVEQTFVQALPTKGPLKPGIKQLGRGRCPVRKCVQPKQGVRQARQGVFNPDSEVFAVRVKQVVKQVRRRQEGMPRSLFVCSGGGCGSKGFGTHFVTWAANHMPAHPNMDTLRALLEHVRTHAERCVAQERKGRILRFEATSQWQSWSRPWTLRERSTRTCPCRVFGRVCPAGRECMTLFSTIGRVFGESKTRKLMTDWRTSSSACRRTGSSQRITGLASKRFKIL